MAEHHSPGRSRGAEAGLARGVVTIVLVGVALGVGFNRLGLDGRPSWGLPWIAGDRLAALESLDDVAPAPDTARPAGGYNEISDPMAVTGGYDELPEIPVLDRPVQIQLDAVKRLFDAGAALFVDARDFEDYAGGHIAGALNIPYDLATVEPERLQGLDSGGRPIVAYCGGGTCEVSLGLAEELIDAGQTRVVVYVGGYDEWAGAGYPVESLASGS